MLTKKQKLLDKIAVDIANCKECQHGKVGKAVPGEGNADASIVFLGEAPGKQEAASGRPFIGRSGKFLRQMLAEVGISEDEVYITSPVKYLPEYITPTEADVVHGYSHLKKQLDTIQPEVVVLMGRVAALAILKEKITVSAIHGQTRKLGDFTVFFAYHPAAALYNPKLRPELLKDFKKLKVLADKAK